MGASCSACIEDATWSLEDGRLKKCDASNTPKFIPEVRRCKVVSVYDGDTITVAARHRLRGPPRLFKVRFSGIDAPEMRGGSPAEKEAAIASRDYLSGLILEKYVVLSDVSLEKYGRLLATVSHRGRDLNRMMIENGHAVAYDGGTKPSFAAADPHPAEVI